MLSVDKIAIMNRLILVLASVALLLCTNFRCRKADDLKGCYKGRLEIKGACGHYTIKVLSGNIDTALIESSWTDPYTNIQYSNVFALDGVCNFPQNISAGDEFYFRISSTPDHNCFVCLAIYPTPAKKLGIHVTDLPCN